MDTATHQDTKGIGSSHYDSFDLPLRQAELLFELDQQTRIEQPLRMLISIHWRLVEQRLLALERYQFGVHHISNGFAFHALLIDLKTSFRFQGRYDPQRLRKALLPVTHQVDFDSAQIVNIGTNHRFARPDEQIDGHTLCIDQAGLPARVAYPSKVGIQTACLVDDTVFVKLPPRLKCAILHMFLLGVWVASAPNFTEEDRFYLFVKEL